MYKTNISQKQLESSNQFGPIMEMEPKHDFNSLYTVIKLINVNQTRNLFIGQMNGKSYCFQDLEYFKSYYEVQRPGIDFNLQHHVTEKLK